MKQPDKQDIEAQARAALDASLEKITPETQSRLRSIRQAALNKAESSPKVWRGLLKPGTIAAISFSFALVFILPQVSPVSEPTEQTMTQQFDDFLLLSELDDDTLELIEELEFAEWLSDEIAQQSKDSKLEQNTSIRSRSPLFGTNSPSKTLGIQAHFRGAHHG